MFSLRSFPLTSTFSHEHIITKCCCGPDAAFKTRRCHSLLFTTAIFHNPAVWTGNELGQICWENIDALYQPLSPIPPWTTSMPYFRIRTPGGLWDSEKRMSEIYNEQTDSILASAQEKWPLGGESNWNEYDQNRIHEVWALVDISTRFHSLTA